MMDLNTRNSAFSIAAQVRSRSLAVEDVSDFFINETEKRSRELNTHLHWDVADIKKQSHVVHQRLERGEQLPLAGVPVLIKDNINVRGQPTTCGSKILTGYVSPYDATVVTRLRDAGAILFGKTNCDEFAMGSSNENSAFGPVKNPWDLSRVPGGSSGGSAAAVAAGLAPLALGSDTGGSIRQPAAFCGLVGLKPTYGRVSRYGLVAYASSLDQIGPFARSVQDAALLYDVIAGHDVRDATSSSRSLELVTSELTQSSPDLRGKKVGLVREFFGDGLDPSIRAALKAAQTALETAGATITEVNLPCLDMSIAAYYIIATAEASSNLARFDGIRYGYRHKGENQSLKQIYGQSRAEGFGREVKQRIMLGTFALSSGYYDAYYGKATQVRAQIIQDFQAAFRSVDVLLAPTSPIPVFKIGEKNADPMSMYLADICTVAANLAKVPAISIPCGIDSNQMPIGMQLMAPHFAEKSLLQVAKATEEKLNFCERFQPKN